METKFSNRIDFDDVIKVFISSTFRDLDEERNYITRVVIPNISSKLEKDGLSIREVDLRWGITDEESREKRVVDLCLQYLHDSKPFFVGILGERYGSVIAPENVELSALVKESYPLVVDDINKGLSVTEIEIMNGVFRASKEQQPKAIFFVKETTNPNQGENDKDFRRLQELKRKVLSQKEFPVVTYTKLEDLDKLKEFILNSLGKYEESGKYEAECNASAISIEPMLKAYNHRLEAFSKISEWGDDSTQLLSRLQDVIERAKPIAVFEGAEGIGKSALVARLASTDRSNLRRYIFIYGDAPLIPACNSLMAELFLNECRRQLQDEYNKQSSQKGLKGWMTRNFKMIDLSIQENLLQEIAKRKWCFVLDETCSLRMRTISPIHHILPNIINALSYLEKENKIKINYRVLLVQNLGSPYSTRDDGYEHLVMPLRNPADGWRYINTYLRQYSKHLGAEQIKQLMACPFMVHPRSVNLVFDYMRLYVKHEQMSAFIKRLTTFTTTKDIYSLYLDQLDSILSWEQQQRLTGLISLFSCGIRERDLMKLSGLSDIDFNKAMLLMNKRLTIESQYGAIRWKNDLIGRFIDEIYGLNDATFHLQLARECSQYFFNQINDLYSPEKLQADLKKNWWLFKDAIIAAIADKSGKSIFELRKMSSFKLLELMHRMKVFNIDFIRNNIYNRLKLLRMIFHTRSALQRSKIMSKDHNNDSQYELEEGSSNHDENFWQLMSRYRQPTITELSCYLESLREAKRWELLEVELANPEIINYVWQTSVVIDCWNVAMCDGGISIIQPDIKNYDKMLFVSYALRNADGIAYYGQYQQTR
jgi:hypothetical protein